jgi:hypothetical protein
MACAAPDAIVEANAEGRLAGYEIGLERIEFGLR